MKRIVFLVCLLLFAFNYGAFAQGTTMSIGSVTAQVGQLVSVPVTVTNFTNVGAISLTINFDTTFVAYDTVANAPPGVVFTAPAKGSPGVSRGVLALAWFDAFASSPFPVTSGKIIDLVFRYKGGSSPLTFNTAACEVVTDANPPIPIAVTYNNGNVGAVRVTLTLGTLTASSGSTINVPITTQNLTRKIGAVSLKINYNPAVLKFVDTAKTASGLGFLTRADSIGGVVTLGWFDQNGLGVTPGSATLVELKFKYAGGTSDLTFLTTQSEVSDSAGVAFPVTFVNGKVSPAPAEAISLALDSTAFAVGTDFLLPLNVRNFKNVGAISLKIRYNAAVLTFTGITNTFKAGFNASANLGVVSITWYSAGPVTPITLTGKLLDLKFTYNGGTSGLEFLSSQSELADSVGTPVQGVVYNNGNVVLFTPKAGWTAQNSGITTGIYQVKALSQTVAWAAGAGGKVLRTINGGVTWSSVGDTTIGVADIYAMDAVDADTAFVTTSPSATYIYRTTNGGTSWTRVYSLAGGFMDGIYMYNHIDGIAMGDPVGGKWVVVKTTDGGATWARIATEPTPLSGEAGWNTSFAVVGSGNTASIWFGTSKSRIFRSTNGGATWSTGATPFVNTYSIWFNDKRFGIAGSDVGTAVRTLDSGATWVASALPTGAGSVWTAGAGAKDFWAARRTNVYRSIDRGVTWTVDYIGVDNFYYVNFATYGGAASGWAGTAAGYIAAAYFATLTSVPTGPTAAVPQAFDLAQNYPNPFNPSTTIEYALPARSNVTLRVYDMLGREVRTLATGVQEAGNFKVTWDGRNASGSTVSSGIYLYRLEGNPLDGGNAFTTFKKMMLLK